MGEKNEHVCPVEKAGGFDSGIRKLLQRPKKILGNYAREGMTVLDLGCGPGFFSVEMAEMVGASGKVISTPYICCFHFPSEPPISFSW